MTVTVIDRAAQTRAWGYGLAGVSAFIRTVEIADACPTCGGPRGEPRLVSYHEDGEGYAVSRWENPCGHRDHYADVLAEAVRP